MFIVILVVWALLPKSISGGLFYFYVYFHFIYKGHQKMFSLGMNVWKMRIKNLWRSSKCASPFLPVSKKCIAIYESQEKLQPLRYARLNNAHHGFTKALKICISFLWVFQKCASRFLQAIKNADVLYERFNNMHHVFTKALKNAHLLFMRLSKFGIMIYEGHKKMLLLCMSASTMCNTVLWRP